MNALYHILRLLPDFSSFSLEDFVAPHNYKDCAYYYGALAAFPNEGLEVLFADNTGKLVVFIAIYLVVKFDY